MCIETVWLVIWLCGGVYCICQWIGYCSS